MTIVPIGCAMMLISSQVMAIYMTPVFMGGCPHPCLLKFPLKGIYPTISHATVARHLHYQLVLKLPVGNALQKIQTVSLAPLYDAIRCETSRKPILRGKHTEFYIMYDAYSTLTM
jgi:hypothetical protein